MKLIYHEEILLPPNRQRKTHNADDHQDLIASIESKGLLHPIVVRSDGDKTFLVAGERRLRAMREIYELGGSVPFEGNRFGGGEVPTTTLGELSPLDAKEAELEENIRRVDLPWQERVAAEAELFDLRSAQAKEKGVLRPHISDIAAEIGSSGQAVTRDIVLARNLHRPEVKAAGSVKEAYKALERVQQTERNREVAAALGKDFLGSKHTLTNGDCLTWMANYQGEPFDVICTDPPYGMGADEFGDSGGGAEGAHFYEDGEEAWEITLRAVVKLYLITKSNAHSYIFCDFDRFHELRKAMGVCGWKVFRTPLIWFKPTAFRAPWPEQGPQRKYECILYAVKGDLKCTKLGGDVLTYPPDENLGHQAQKPVALIQDLLSRSVRPGMLVLDPFCGTGPIFPAAHSLSGVATGIEIDAAAYAIATSRITLLKEGK